MLSPVDFAVNPCFDAFINLHDRVRSRFADTRLAANALRQPGLGGLPPTLRRFFATTNCIENLIGTLRHVSRNVKRWRAGDMRQRWLGLGLLRAAERLHRIKHHSELRALATGLGAAAVPERAA